MLLIQLMQCTISKTSDHRQLGMDCVIDIQMVPKDKYGLYFLILILQLRKTKKKKTQPGFEPRSNWQDV